MRALAEARSRAGAACIRSGRAQFPAEARHYKVSKQVVLGADMVNWGGTSRRRSNPWVTADASRCSRRRDGGSWTHGLTWPR